MDISNQRGKPTACVLRWGGWGDMVQATVLFDPLKAMGYHLTVHCNPRGHNVIKHDPRVDSVVHYKDDTVNPQFLEQYWNEIASQWDKFINLSGSVEGHLLKVEGDPEFEWSHEERHERCNVNYIEETFRRAEIDPGPWDKNPQMFYSASETVAARAYRKKHKGRFLVMWCLSGSSPHKSWPYVEYALRDLMFDYDDIDIVLVGDYVCSLLVSRPWVTEGNRGKARRIKDYSGRWSLRQTLAMTEYVDLIIGPETGILNAAAGLTVPKILLLSHSSEENLSKYWVNTSSLTADVHCQPCHRLHYTMVGCELDQHLETPICMTQLKPHAVSSIIDKKYQEWRNA